MDARQLLQSKQKAIAAIKAQQYPEAVHILEEVRAASPGGILLDPVLAEMLSTLQQKVAQDAASSSSDGDEDTSSETGSDDSGGEECSSASGDLSEDEEPSSDHADDTSAGEGSQDAPGGLQQSCPVPDSNTAASAQHHAPHLSTHAAGTSKIPSAAQDMASQQQAQLSTPSGTTAAGAELDSSTDTNGPQQAAAVPWPVVDAIQLAPGSCSLTHNEHAHLRQQLLASLEADKEAAALQQALADDPLLSLSLS